MGYEKRDDIETVIIDDPYGNRTAGVYDTGVSGFNNKYLPPKCSRLYIKASDWRCSRNEKLIKGRIYDLIIKLISVKGVLFIAFLVLAVPRCKELSIPWLFSQACFA